MLKIHPRKETKLFCTFDRYFCDKYDAHIIIYRLANNWMYFERLSVLVFIDFAVSELQTVDVKLSITDTLPSFKTKTRTWNMNLCVCT